MDGMVIDHGLAGLTTDVVVHRMDQDPHEKALDYSVSDPEKHRVNEVQYSVASSTTCTTWLEFRYGNFNFLTLDLSSSLRLEVNH